jgi:SAM-dependent methyltransferase
MSDEAEHINRAVWRSARVLDIFARRDGWTDPGEALLMRRVAAEASRQPILDIGVGAGRTLPYLHSLSEDYVAVDNLEEMVQLTRSRYPGVRIERADARDLSAFADGTFGLVCFSFNGIDGIAHEDRRQVHAAVKRVLRPGGLFAYSTHNLEHRCAGRPPWDRCRFRLGNGLRPIVGSVLRLPRSMRSYERLRSLTVRGDGWALLVDPAYNFSVVWHYVTLEEAQRELRESGYDPAVEVYSTVGARVSCEDDTSASPWLHVLARNPRTR